NAPETPEIYTLSLHDALPIYVQRDQDQPEAAAGQRRTGGERGLGLGEGSADAGDRAHRAAGLEPRRGAADRAQARLGEGRRRRRSEERRGGKGRRTAGERGHA